MLICGDPKQGFSLLPRRDSSFSVEGKMQLITSQKQTKKLQKLELKINNNYLPSDKNRDDKRFLDTPASCFPLKEKKGKGSL